MDNGDNNDHYVEEQHHLVSRLSEQETKVLADFRQWQQDNQIVSQWFVRHKDILMKQMKTFGVERIELMGSRRWGLSYPESDIDAALVTTSEPTYIAHAVADFYGQRTKDVKRRVTNAGLHLVIIDSFPDNELPRGKITLEYTVQTNEQNQRIRQTVEEATARMSLQERASYVSDKRQCFLTGNEERKRTLKAWLQALPEL
jgi:predicted nucleotidyltransferase